jgi:dTDP-4-dehydrorhamnose reductase
MTEKPFIHKKAFNDVQMNFMFHEDLAKNLLKLINYKGIINVGGKTQSVYSFAKKNNNQVLKISAKKLLGNDYPLKQSMNINHYLKLLKNKN